MSESLQDRIIRHEGLRLHVYKDSLGFDTIGVGHLLSNGISQAVAMLILDEDILKCKEQIGKELPWALLLNDIRLGVLIEMCFQLGIKRLLMFKKMLNALKSRDYADAASEMINSTWHTQTPNRCEELARIMKYGEKNDL